MRTWNTPSVQDLDVRMTASSGNPGATEAPGYLGNGGWVQPTFNSAVYEDNGDCVIAKKDNTQS